MPSSDVGGIVELVPDPLIPPPARLASLGLIAVASDDIRLQCRFARS